MAAWFGSAFRRGAAAFRKQIVVDDFWSDVRRNASVFVRIGAVIHVIRKYGVEPTAVSMSMSPGYPLWMQCHWRAAVHVTAGYAMSVTDAETEIVLLSRLHSCLCSVLERACYPRSI